MAATTAQTVKADSESLYLQTDVNSMDRVKSSIDKLTSRNSKKSDRALVFGLIFFRNKAHSKAIYICKEMVYNQSIFGKERICYE